MFAVLSWIEESVLLESYFENENKGVIAVIAGSNLYYFLGRHVESTYLYPTPGIVRMLAESIFFLKLLI